MRTIVFVSVALVACSNKGPSDKSTCEALAISAANSKALLDLATMQYVSADHAMAKWEQWQKQTVTEEENGTGGYSGAGDRANRYRAAGNALCLAATLNYWQMRELGRDLDDQRVSQNLWDLNDFNCVITKSPIAPDVEIRKAFMTEWKSRTAHVREVATRVLDECFTKLGGATQEIVMPPTFLPTE